MPFFRWMIAFETTASMMFMNIVAGIFYQQVEADAGEQLKSPLTISE